MRGLSEHDLAVWHAATSDVRPIDHDGVQPIPASFHRSPVQSEPKYVIDLHGMTIADAHTRAKRFIEDAFERRTKYVIVITGRSGEIYREFPLWAQGWRGVRSHETLASGGAFRINLTRR